MPNTYGYARVSMLDERKNKARGHDGLSIDSQAQRMRAYFDYQCSGGHHLARTQWSESGWRGLRETGHETTDGLFVDQDVSAWKRPLLSRPAGRRLSTALETGDCVIFSRLDRAFRSVKDAVITIDLWSHRGIGIHFLDPQVDLSTAHGRAFMQMSAVWAEFSSSLLSERMQEINAQQRRQGRRINRFKATGWKTFHKTSTPQPDYEERAILSWIIYLRDEKKLSWRGLADVVEEELARRENRKPVSRFHGEGARRFGFNRCIRGYKTAKELLLLEPTPELIIPVLER